MRSQVLKAENRYLPIEKYRFQQNAKLRRNRAQKIIEKRLDPDGRNQAHMAVDLTTRPNDTAIWLFSSQYDLVRVPNTIKKTRVDRNKLAVS